MRSGRGEDGQILLLGVGVIAVVAALVLVAASATAVHLDLKTLTSLADSAAAAAVDGVDEDGYYGGVEADGATAVVTLTARSRPPFLPWGVIPSQGFVITATGSARMTTAP